MAAFLGSILPTIVFKRWFVAAGPSRPSGLGAWANAGTHATTRQVTSVAALPGRSSLAIVFKRGFVAAEAGRPLRPHARANDARGLAQKKIYSDSL